MVQKKCKKKIFKKEDIPLYMMALPTVVLLILFNYIPIGGLTLAFKKYNASKGIFGSPWNGLKNFEYLFASSDAFVIVRNTVLYNLIFIFVGTILAVVVAILLGEIHSKMTAKVFQTIYIMPFFLSWAVVSIFVDAYLSRSNGLVNHIIQAMGGEGGVNWYTQINLWPPLLVFIYMWKSVGYNAVVYLAAISGISQEYYEAAMLDGANRFQQARYITIPQLRMIVSLMLITSMGSIFRGDFGLFHVVTKDTGALYPVTNVIDTYIYNGMKNQGNVGMTTAAGLFQSIVGFLTLLLANKVVSKIDADSAMF